MSKEQIIIDGVDVSGCDFLAKEDDYCSYSGETRAYKGQCGCSDEEMCKDHPNCFYKKALKQLKRKEQECGRLKKKLNPKLKNAHCAYFEGQTGLCKAKEFTRCNPVNCKLYTIDELSTIVDLQQQLDQLKAENEELRKNLVDKHTSRCFRLVTHREFNKSIIETVQLRQENNKLKQTLTEIKEIMKKHCRKCQKDKFYHFKLCCTCKYTDILQKINEVLKDE